MTVAVLAVQGAFAEHERVLRSLGAEVVELRRDRDALRPFDALVLPGGESTAQGKMLRELGMFEPLLARIRAGLPVFATCAGLILLAESVENDGRRHFGTLPVTVRRNAYGRQLGSFRLFGPVVPVGDFLQEYIRAPGIVRAAPEVEILSTAPDGAPTAVRHGAQWAFAFHPELSPDPALHRVFLASL
ncbi:MAG: pyridoxal 5'-phosphate synthase glutaminase subunit PdxT [Kiritimatiellae bacterium]|nr:pyridoxal 5'-phosphate synthase glutaminase subunit PdxT [Kiritimatiellia bacterium]